MMLNIRVSSQTESRNSLTFLGLVVMAIIVLQLLLVLNYDFINLNVQNVSTNYLQLNNLMTYDIWFDNYFRLTNMEAIGFVLYTEYSYLFILSSLILLVAMIGVIVLTLHQRTLVKKQNLSVQLSREATGVVRFVKTVINT